MDFPTLTCLLIIFIINPSMAIISLPPQLEDRIRADPEAIKSASTDYGHIVSKIPAAVLYPESIEDIKTLISFSYNSSDPYNIAAKGCAHSVYGQAMANNGVVIDMLSLNGHRNGTGIVVSGNQSSGFFYADVGGEQLWIDVLQATLKEGLTPVSWTDYLHITVGGTLSNAGISGQTHRRGPQISNVLELDVVTGTGELVTCSPQRNSELFYGVLGGLGQFGIITRARILLEPAKTRVRWLRIFYSDFASFIADQEQLISDNGKFSKQFKKPDYLEGSLLMGPNSLDSFFPSSDHSRILSLINKFGTLYSLEVGQYYDDDVIPNIIDMELRLLLKSLSNFIPGFIFRSDVSYMDFLNRVHKEELTLQSLDLWEVPHPWLNLFLPKSRMLDFNNGVFQNILLKGNFTTGLVLVYPMFRNKWDERMSAVIPDEEDVFYTVAFLDSSGFDNWQVFADKNKEILQFCESSDIKVKQYLGHHSKEEWISHFGTKWKTFEDRKAQFDPKMILSPGQGIFNNI